MIKWILQKNLTNNDTLNQMKIAIEKAKQSFEEITVVPFSKVLDFNGDINEKYIFYGSTTLMLNVYNDEKYKDGVFYDVKNFQIKKYLEMWKTDLLNYDSEILNIIDFIDRDYELEKEFFIRPNDDEKSFAGMVTSFGDFRNMVLNVIEDSPSVRKDLLINIAKPKIVEKEWRNFIVKGKVIDSSRYAINSRLEIDKEDVPKDMIEFTERCSDIYSPHDVFVLDIGYSNNRYYIIEANCFNGTGYYNHNIYKIVQKVSEFLELKS